MTKTRTIVEIMNIINTSSKKAYASNYALPNIITSDNNNDDNVPVMHDIIIP